MRKGEGREEKGGRKGEGREEKGGRGGRRKGEGNKIISLRVHAHMHA